MIFASAIKDKNGNVHIGRRHHDIINSANPKGSLKGCEQGFITDSGFFLDRELAALYALKIGQIKELKFNSKQLFSEDLW